MRSKQKTRPSPGAGSIGQGAKGMESKGETSRGQRADDGGQSKKQRHVKWSEVEGPMSFIFVGWVDLDFIGRNPSSLNW